MKRKWYRANTDLIKTHHAEILSFLFLILLEECGEHADLVSEELDKAFQGTLTNSKGVIGLPECTDSQTAPDMS